MSAEGVHITCTWGEHRTMNALGEAIQRRVRDLGETTEQAVTAMTINTLRSLRAETSVAKKKNPKIIDERWLVEMELTGYTVGWATPANKGYKKGHRVFRLGGGRGTANTIDPVTQNRLVNVAGPYLHAGEAAVKCYRLKITERPATKPFYETLILAKNTDDIWKFARLRIIRRIGQYSGVSKRLLGLAMPTVAEGKGEAPGGDRISQLAGQKCRVVRSGVGYNTGEISITVDDQLPFSALALKHGPAGVHMAMARAANAAAGQISRKVKSTGFGEKWLSPFPEYAAKSKEPPTNFYDGSGWVTLEKMAANYRR